MNKIQKQLLEEVSALHSIPQGAISLRVNGESEILNSTAEIILTKKENKSGLDILIKKNTNNKSLHIPVLLDKNLNEEVFNDFVIEDNASVLIVAGCGVHVGSGEGKHCGVHSFKIGKNCKVKYIERHLGLGESTNKTINTKTIVALGENSSFEMETTQIKGVDFSDRITNAVLEKNSVFIVREKILTELNQTAKTDFKVTLKGENSSCEIISRAVGKHNSFQDFGSELIGQNKCFGRVECDAIIFDNAKIYSSPAVKAETSLAELSHEAQIGKIAGEQLVKLMTLGLSEENAKNKIIEGYLR